MSVSRKQNRVGRTPLALAALAAAAGVGRSASAAQYIYTPVNGANDLWSTGADWSPGAPVSDDGTQLTFTADNSTVFTAGFVANTSNNIAAPFHANEVDLNGTGPATGTATINITGINSSAGLYVPNNGFFNLVANGSGLTYNILQPVTFGGSVAFYGDGTANFNFSGGFTGSGANIQKYGASTLTISGPVTSGGGQFTLAGGTIRLAGSASLAGEAVKFYNGGTVLDLGGTSPFTAALDEDNNSFTGATIENNATGTSILTIDRIYSPTLGVTLVDNTNGGSGKLGIAVNNGFTIVSNNTYSGPTTLNNGTTLTLGNGGSNGSIGTSVVGGNGTLAINRSDAALTIAGLSGSAGLAQNGTGTTTVTRAGTTTGGVNVNNGVLVAAASAALGTGGIAVNSNTNNSGTAGTLALTGGSTLANSVQVAGTGSNGSGAIINLSGANTLSGFVTVAGNNAGATSFTSNAGTLTFSGGFDKGGNVVTLGGAGNGAFTGGTVNLGNGPVYKVGTGTWDFATPATFSSSIHVMGGTTAFANGGLGTSSTINFAGGVLQYDAGNTQDVSNLIHYADYVNGNPQPIAVNTNGNTVTFASSLDNTNQGGLTKLGSGPLILAADETYGGPTVVGGGRLVVNGTIENSTNHPSSVTVGDGANASTGTLVGTGTVATGTTIQTGGTISAGSGALNNTSIGKLSVTGGLTLAGGQFVDKASGSGNITANDQLALSTLSVTATTPVSLLALMGTAPKFTATSTPGGTPVAGSFIVLADDMDTNTSTNPFASSAVLSMLTLTDTGVSPNKTGDAIVLATQADASGTGFDLIAEDVTATPEPTSVLLLTAVAAPLALGRRRRDRTA